MSTRFNDFLNEINWKNNRVLDLCSGSGCIGITLALLNSKIQVDLADISFDALEVAHINVNEHSLNNRVKCIQSDLFDNIENKYDLIITNPPYWLTWFLIQLISSTKTLLIEVLLGSHGVMSF